MNETNQKPAVNPLPRQLSLSEYRELSALVADYMALNPKADANELQKGVMDITLLYNDVLNLRYPEQTVRAG